MRWWPQAQGILAGRDEVAGGTWFGVTRSGKWAAVTNYREPNPDRQQASSRGELVVNFLNADISAAGFVESLSEKADDYNGFNLLLSDGDHVFWFSNREFSSGASAVALEPGIYGLSNHLIDTPWPKVELAKKRLSNLLASEDIQPNLLMELLFDDSTPPGDQLPDTGVGLAKERLLSSMFIASQSLQYGTRCTTAMTITCDNHLVVAEKSYPDQSVLEFSFEARH